MRSRPRLERVLRVRQLEEEITREQFISCQSVARRAEQVADGIGAEIARAHTELSETRLQARIPPEDLVIAQTTLESLEENLAEQKRRARNFTLEADEKRTTWERARRDMRTIERIEERLRAADRESERRLEAREMDEQALRRGPVGPAFPQQPAPSSPGAWMADEEAIDAPGVDPR
jgi:flagellar export protein FliJ